MVVYKLVSPVSSSLPARVLYFKSREVRILMVLGLSVFDNLIGLQ